MDKFLPKLLLIAIFMLLLAVVFPVAATSDTTDVSGKASDSSSLANTQLLTNQVQTPFTATSNSVKATSVTTIDFEKASDGSPLLDLQYLTNQVQSQGVTFSGARIRTAGGSLNVPGYPPRSGKNIIYSPDGTITANFSHSASYVNFYYWSKYNLYFDAYDQDHKLLKTMTGAPDTTGYAHGPQEYSLTINNTSGIASVVIRSTGDYYVIDDFSFDNTGMKLSDKGVIFITKHEGCPMKNGLAIMYNDAGNHCTIGYGHLIHYGPINGDPSEKPYKNGITLDKARELFKTDVARFEASVNKVVKVPLTQSQFDALVSITYNSGALGSPVLNDLNKGNYNAVSKDILTYRITSKGKVVKGLINRRKDESTLFSTGKY